CTDAGARKRIPSADHRCRPKKTITLRNEPMYLYEDQLIETAAQPWEAHRTLRPSQRYQFGEAAAPRGLILLDHFQSPKQPDPAKPGQFITGSVTKLAVTDMNPGFIDQKDQLITDTSSSGLQTCLHKLITTQFQNYLYNKQTAVPSGNDRLHVALVDLT